MGQVLLVRHGESTANARRVWQGHADYPLADDGLRQARAVAAVLAGRNIDALWASPLQRAWRTAEVIAEFTGHEIRPDERLKEIDIGAASGLTHDDVELKFPERSLALKRGDSWEFPGQEPHDQFVGRIDAVLTDMLATEGTVVAVTHGGLIRRAAFDIMGFPGERSCPFSIGNCSITEIMTGPTGDRDRVLRRLNDLCHLEAQARVSADHHVHPTIH